MTADLVSLTISFAAFFNFYFKLGIVSLFVFQRRVGAI